MVSDLLMMRIGIPHVGTERPSNHQDVHFHRGPQGRPAPCYDEHCSIPQMSSEAVREAALATDDSASH